jgi:HAD superfamily hydrolase (TIGR01509 family)
MTPRASDIQAVVFDMDGTLLDTELVFKSIVYEVADGLGFEMRDDVHLAMVGSSHETTQGILVEAYGVTFPYTLFDEQCRVIMKERMADAVPVKTGVFEILSELRDRRIPMAVATSSRAPHAITHLGSAGLLDMFDTIVTRNDVENPKPHPEPYLLAASRLRIDPVHCLALEDSHSGVRAAHAAGMHTVMVPDLVPPTAEIVGLCHAVMDSLHQVRERYFPPFSAPRR